MSSRDFRRCRESEREGTLRPLPKNRTRPEERGDKIKEGVRVSGKRHSHRFVLQAHLDLDEDTGEEEEEEEGHLADREITSIVDHAIARSYSSPSGETGGNRRRSKFCRDRADSCEPPLLHLLSVHILCRRKEKGERDKEGGGKEREEEKAREACACCAVRSTATAATGCIECRPASRRLKIDGRSMQQPPLDLRVLVELIDD